MTPPSASRRAALFVDRRHRTEGCPAGHTTSAPAARPDTPRTDAPGPVEGVGIGVAGSSGGSEQVAATEDGDSDAPQPIQGRKPTSRVETPPPETPNPEAEYAGYCDYNLGSGTGSDYEVIGEIELDNVGNVGVVAKTRITWPQLGHDPIRASKKVRVDAGDSKVVRFAKQVTGEQIDLLQSSEMRKPLAESCTYQVEIIDTFGNIQ